MKNMKIKEWFYDKLCDEARRFNVFIDVTDYSRDSSTDSIKPDKDGYIEVIAVEIIKETEKAVNVRLGSGSVVGSCKGWTCWIPKSQTM